MCKEVNKRKGIDLRDEKAHASDHKQWSRRSFMQTIGLAGASSFGVGMLPITGLHGFPLAGMLDGRFSNRKLVLIRLKGGNDGLNTIVPLYDYDSYAVARPRLRHERNTLLKLNDDFGIPSVMTDMMPLWNNGKMRVINSVGYPDHNLSHFTGADIMASGDNNVDDNSDGWLARFYTQQNPDYLDNPPADPPAVKIGGPTSILFNDENSVDISANFSSADRLEALAQTGIRYNNQNAPDACYYGDQVVFLRTIANAAFRYSQSIFDAYNAAENSVTYRSTLGDQLRLVSRLIKGGLNTQLYLVTLDGFDTHVSQNEGGTSHLNLLENVSQAVKDFYDDLEATGHDRDVLSMTYSEFGRRVEENGFAGTDHGTALPIMMFGPALEGSDTHGKNPDFDDLDQVGNLKFGTDFRSIYATLLEQWFCIEPDEVDAILGTAYSRLPDIGINCRTTSTQTPTVTSTQHRLVPNGSGTYDCHFSLTRAAEVELSVTTISGRQLIKTPRKYLHAGEHIMGFDLSDLGVKLAPMVYTLFVDGRPLSGKFLASSY